jgi:hypothetical protein
MAFWCRKVTGKHYNWHKRWSVADTPGAIRHESGLVVQFARSDDLVGSGDIGTLCWAPDGSRWVGRLVGGDEALGIWLQEQAARGLRDPASINNRLARLMREAGEWYVMNVFGASD